jgi:ferredoxin--NADP+ reductase
VRRFDALMCRTCDPFARFSNSRPGFVAVRQLRMRFAMTTTYEYNATVTHFRRIHEDLLILRLRPDFGPLEYLPGQYVTLGLGSWEPHLDCEEPAGSQREMIRRAYSISHMPIDEQGNLQRPGEQNELEFYVALVRQSPLHRLLLTPRLFALEVERRIYVSPHAHGSYTLAHLPREANVLFAATGTGEAPHNAMIAELLATGHLGRIASVVCVRHRRDLGYADAHQQLAERYGNYRYLPLTTREPENLDPTRPDFVGKQYIQDFVRSSAFAERAGFVLDPGKTHVFLCGNPEMIGLNPHAAGHSATGMIAILESLGFTVHSEAHPGNIHFERYF